MNDKKTGKQTVKEVRLSLERTAQSLERLCEKEPSLNLVIMILETNAQRLELLEEGLQNTAGGVNHVS